ncbi:MAG TPA: small ribosomal subunit Rsm22 family protein [Nitrospirota bacterium]|nr:small ribosomal subunit Rsm22 family protein [Nitrospirota bacterium]
MTILRGQSKDREKILAADVVKLSRLFTRQRECLPTAYLKDPGLREAYRAYFLPPNLAKIRMPLAELALHRKQIPVKDTIRVLDLGSGPGTALLGVMEYFAAHEKKPALQCVAVDQVTENLAVAEELFHAERISLGLSASLKTVHAGIERADQHLSGSFDLIILSNILNELFTHEGRRIEKRLSVLEEIVMPTLAEDGTCIIIEPALRDTSRDLLQIRDGLLERSFSIYAPCLCSSGCPALANLRDWCHEDLPWNPPAEIEAVVKLTGLRKDSLKFSYLIVRKDGRSLADVFDEKCFRVVSEPLITKGKIEFFLCGREGRRLCTRLDKDETPANARLRSLRRGYVAQFDPLIDGGTRYKVGKETGVSIKYRPY